MIVPNYSAMHGWELYTSAFPNEYIQSYDGGLDVEHYRDVFSAVADLPKGDIKRLGDVLYDAVISAELRPGYLYNEPSELQNIQGEGDFGRSICMAVETGLDTDCNGATVGSILDMANGAESIPEYRTKPFNDTLYTTIFGLDKLKISELAEKTMKQIQIYRMQEARRIATGFLHTVYERIYESGRSF